VKRKEEKRDDAYLHVFSRRSDLYEKRGEMSVLTYVRKKRKRATLWSPLRGKKVPERGIFSSNSGRKTGGGDSLYLRPQRGRTNWGGEAVMVSSTSEIEIEKGDS